MSCFYIKVNRITRIWLLRIFFYNSYPSRILIRSNKTHPIWIEPNRSAGPAELMIKGGSPIDREVYLPLNFQTSHSFKAMGFAFVNKVRRFNFKPTPWQSRQPGSSDLPMEKAGEMRPSDLISRWWHPTIKSPTSAAGLQSDLNSTVFSNGLAE